jgi:hypothetical protein
MRHYAFRKILGMAALVTLLLQPFPSAYPTLVRADPGAAEPARVAPKALPQTSASSDDQTDLSITVYNSDLALVRDVRNVTLPAGASQLKFLDIAASVNPATVHFRSLDDPGRLTVQEQNYEYDLLAPEKLLDKYVGREVTLMRSRIVNGSTESEDVKATLLANNNGPVWKIGNEIVTGFTPTGISFPDLPENLYDRPTLLWALDNRGAQRQKMEVSYLASKLSWSADYVLTIHGDDSTPANNVTADLDGWVTLANNSGTGFQNARLQLVAGELNRVRPEAQYDSMKTVTVTGQLAGAIPAPFQQEAFNEYHLYTLQRPTSIANSESKQISLLNAAGIGIVKTYEVDGQPYYYRSAIHPGAPLKDPVQVYYEFKNDEKSHLGMPLPAGTIRVYQSDSHGNTLFAGEDSIGHTPKDETIRLHEGNAFDIVAERKQTDYKQPVPQLREMEYEITLRNHKDTPVTVEVNEPIGGDWEILDSTQPWTKTAAFAAQFHVPVEANGTAVLRYRVQVRY